MNLKITKSKGDYIDGEFIKSKNTSPSLILSPADLSDTVFEFAVSMNHVEGVCASAAKAYPIWSALSPSKRNGYLKKLASIYKKNTEDIAITISRETGKPLWESRLEAHALYQKIEVTLKESMPLVRDSDLFSVRSGAKGKIAYRSRGVFLVLGPFNFPVHLPNGQIIAALVLGNTVIFKPSEKTPASAEKLAECFDKAGFPKGVFNLIQGDSKIARNLVEKKEIDGVLFTGSYKVGQLIKKQVLHQPHKILALEMGGRNCALVWKDAHVENAVHEILKGAYLTCGQRCSATTSIILHKKIKNKFLKKFIQLSQKLKIVHWRDSPFMGPLIDQKALKLFSKLHKEAHKEKAFFHLKGGVIHSMNGYYVKPSVVEPLTYENKSFIKMKSYLCHF